MSSQARQLRVLAEELAKETKSFGVKLGPGRGDRESNRFIKKLDAMALEKFGKDYAENLLGNFDGSRVDFFFPDERTVVEVAMGLRNPTTEFEKDVLKVLVAKMRHGIGIDKLIFLTKRVGGDSGEKKCLQPFRKNVRMLCEEKFGIRVEVHDLN